MQPGAPAAMVWWLFVVFSSLGFLPLPNNLYSSLPHSPVHLVSLHLTPLPGSSGQWPRWLVRGINMWPKSAQSDSVSVFHCCYGERWWLAVYKIGGIHSHFITTWETNQAWGKQSWEREIERKREKEIDWFLLTPFEHLNPAAFQARSIPGLFCDLSLYTSLLS